MCAGRAGRRLDSGGWEVTAGLRLESGGPQLEEEMSRVGT